MRTTLLLLGSVILASGCDSLGGDTTVSGTVVECTGAVVPNVVVTLRRNPRGWVPPPRLATTTTDAAGRFSLTAEGGDDGTTMFDVNSLGYGQEGPVRDDLRSFHENVRTGRHTRLTVELAPAPYVPGAGSSCP